MNSINKFDPFRLSRIWDDFNDQVLSRGLKIHETDNDIIAEAVVAGVPSDNVEVHMEDGVLTIKAESASDSSDDNGRQSMTYQYYYTAALSGGEWDKTTAEIENGIVKITVPKAEASRPRKIEIKPTTK